MLLTEPRYLYIQSLGQLGRVTVFDQCGHPCIVVNGYQWVMHSSCVVPAPGEQPENEQSMIDMTVQYHAI